MAYNEYFPGQSVHFTVAASQFGVPTDPPSIVLTVWAPDGTTYTPSVTHDSTGNYHADFVIPASTVLVGKNWFYRWSATGGSNSADAELGFFVKRPLFG